MEAGQQGQFSSASPFVYAIETCVVRGPRRLAGGLTLARVVGLQHCWKLLPTPKKLLKVHNLALDNELRRRGKLNCWRSASYFSAERLEQRSSCGNWKVSADFRDCHVNGGFSVISSFFPLTSRRSFSHLVISKLRTKTDEIIGLPYGSLVEWNKQTGKFDRVLEAEDDDYVAGSSVCSSQHFFSSSAQNWISFTF